MSDYLNIKCVLVGDSRTGKTTFVKRHLTGQFHEEYVPTKDVDLFTLEFQTSRGPISFNVWDTAGQEALRGLKDINYMQARCAIVMFDVTRPETFFNVGTWRRELVRLYPDIPTVLCANKTDFLMPLSLESIFHLHHMPYFLMSVKSTYNYEAPFLMLARRLTGDPKLTFVEQVEVLNE